MEITGGYFFVWMFIWLFIQVIYIFQPQSGIGIYQGGTNLFPANEHQPPHPVSYSYH